MRCEELEPAVADYVEGTLSPDHRRSVEQHLESCAQCRALVEDVRTIQASALTLDRLAPGDEIWERIRTRVAEPELPGGRVLPFSRGTAAWGVWLAAAAALVLATVAGVYPLLQREGAPAPAAVADSAEPGDAELVASVEANLQAAESHYEKAIADLEKIARSENETLDPQVAAVFQKNLQVVDQAIGESRAALREQPTSENAQESLFDAMRTKVSLLQQAVELVNEMRKGNQAEAGRIIQGINQP